MIHSRSHSCRLTELWAGTYDIAVWRSIGTNWKRTPRNLHPPKTYSCIIKGHAKTSTKFGTSGKRLKVCNTIYLGPQQDVAVDLANSGSGILLPVATFSSFTTLQTRSTFHFRWDIRSEQVVRLKTCIKNLFIFNARYKIDVLNKIGVKVISINLASLLWNCQALNYIETAGRMFARISPCFPLCLLKNWSCWMAQDDRRGIHMSRQQQTETPSPN